MAIGLAARSGDVTADVRVVPGNEAAGRKIDYYIVPIAADVSDRGGQSSAQEIAAETRALGQAGKRALNRITQIVVDNLELSP